MNLQLKYPLKNTQITLFLYFKLKYTTIYLPKVTYRTHHAG